MSERIKTIAERIAAEMSKCEEIGSEGDAWTVERAHGVLATVHNDRAPDQGIWLRLERGRLHINGRYPRAADNWTPHHIERPAITVDPRRDPAGIVRRDIAGRFWQPYCQALAQTIEENNRRAQAERRRQEALAQLAQAGDGAVSRAFPELVSGRRWEARVGLSGVQSLELRSLDLETACAVLELVAGDA